MHEIEPFLKQYSPGIQDLAKKTRSLILEVMPGMVEQVDPSANLIGYGIDRTYKGLVCCIILYKAFINLMFARGASLPDPHGLLKGTGKKARHIRIASEEDLVVPGVRDLLEAASHNNLNG